MKVAKTFGFVGIVAAVVLGAYGTAHAPAPAVASSGHGSSSGEYTQPSVGGMNMGATATMTTPSAIEGVPSAAPPVKAAPYHG